MVASSKDRKYGRILFQAWTCVQKTYKTLHGPIGRGRLRKIKNNPLRGI